MAFGLLLVIGVFILAAIGSDLPPGCISGKPFVGASDKGHLILCGGNEGAVTINGVDILNTLTQLNHQVTTTFDFNSPSSPSLCLLEPPQSLHLWLLCSLF